MFMTRQFLAQSARRSSCLKLSKGLHNTPQLLQHEVREIEIPVPWGKVAGKLWGSQEKQPVLALHGWQDNAASFDKIAPLIVKNTPVLAIDLPGHGLSSWLPPGFMYTELVYFLLMKRIQRYFGWEKIKVIAHSLSAMMIYWYAATFPKELQYVIALDFFKFPAFNVTMYAAMFSNAVNRLFELEESGNPPPRYTYDEVLEKGLSVHAYITLEKAAYKILMTRGVTKEEDGLYVFNRDPRLRVLPVHSGFSQEQLEQYAELIRCPYLIIKGNAELYVEEKENFYRALELLKANNTVQFETINATHHLHLTHAEATAAIINPFLEKYN